MITKIFNVKFKEEFNFFFYKLISNPFNFEKTLVRKKIINSIFNAFSFRKFCLANPYTND